MRSSYKNKDITYGELISTITQIVKPKKILEIGILDGYSLESFVKSSHAEIHAFDIFEEFNGNHPDIELLNRFKQFPNVTIQYGNFYNLHNKIGYSEYDIIHIDIANTGDTFHYVMEHYLPKLSEYGIILFEGGSIARDNVEWMIKYNKSPIYPVIQQYTNVSIKTYGNMPSLTVANRI